MHVVCMYICSWCWLLGVTGVHLPWVMAQEFLHGLRPTKTQAVPATDSLASCQVRYALSATVAYVLGHKTFVATFVATEPNAVCVLQDSVSALHLLAAGMSSSRSDLNRD
jgi:hypothetical protein